MANYTPNLNLGKPESSDEFGDFLDLFNDNMDILDQALEEAGTNLAELYDDTATYSVGDYVVYEGVLYKCNTPVTVAETFDPTKWTQVAITDEMGGGGGSSVTWTQFQQSGTKIAEIAINGTSQDVYAPQGGGSSDIVELTQAEYDALPDTKLTDDTMYLIKDGESAEDKIPDELNDLSDVNISSPTRFEGLVYDQITQKWVNGYPKGVTTSNGLVNFTFSQGGLFTEDVEYYGALHQKPNGDWEFNPVEPLFKVINGELCQVYDDGN